MDVATTVGYPAGMPRTMVLPLGDLPEGARNIRLHSTLECYIDALRIAWAEPCPEARVHRLEPSTAILHPAGYPRRTSGAQKRPIYDWSNRTPFWDVRAQSGLYTRLGDVRPLLERTDGVIAVYGAGDSVHLAFDELPPPASGVRRQWVLEVAGWAKDMDFMTRTGATVAPLPGNRTPEGAALQQATQVRWRDGR